MCQGLHSPLYEYHLVYLIHSPYEIDITVLILCIHYLRLEELQAASPEAGRTRTQNLVCLTPKMARQNAQKLFQTRSGRVRKGGIIAHILLSLQNIWESNI